MSNTIIIAIGLFLAAVILFASAKLKWITNSTLETFANVATILALLLAIILIFLPSIPKSEPEITPHETPTILLPTGTPDTVVPDPTRTPEPTATDSTTPAVSPTPTVVDLSGTWLTNVAKLTLSQEGSDIGLAMEGYGGFHNDFASGVIDGSHVFFKDTGFLGDIAIDVDETGTKFQSTDQNLSFCGVRSGSLPVGCGFTGKWLLSDSEGILEPGTYAALIQTGSTVHGTVYRPSGGHYDAIEGEVIWGKGWFLEGKGVYQFQEFTWSLTSNERSFHGFDDGSDNSWFGSRESKQAITGRIVDSNGNPVDRVGVVAIHDKGEDRVRVDADSGYDGKFYLSLPDDSEGMWEIQIVGIDCTSRIMDSNCRMSGYFERNNREFVALPQSEYLELVYEIATTSIQGVTVDSLGNPSPNVRVVATRDDGATSWTNSDESGAFSLAASTGDWDVFARLYDPEIESEHFYVGIGERLESDSLVLQIP